MDKPLSYKTSRDYKRLKELLDEGYEVVCFITYDWNQYNKNEPDYEPYMVTDVCTARLLSKGGKYEHYSISCRGTGFLDYFTKDMDYKYTFEEYCEARDIEFIEPNIEK